MEKIDINVPNKVLAFARVKDDNKVSVYINMSAEPQNVIVTNKWDYGAFTDLISGRELLISGTTAFEIPAWGYFVLKEKK
jgi:hypothetical protein